MKPLLILVLICLAPTLINGRCPGTIADTTVTCPNTMVLTSTTLPNYPFGSFSKLSFSFNMKLTSRCSTTSVSELTLFAITITPSGGSETKLLEVTWSDSTKSFSFYTVNFNGIRAKIMDTTATPESSMDLTTNYISLSGAVVTTGWISTSALSAHFLSNAAWKSYSTSSNVVGTWEMFFDSLKIYWGSDIGGANPVSFNLYDVKIWYDGDIYNNYESFMVAGMTPVPLARYMFSEGTGYSAAASLGTLGSAYLGASTASTTDAANSPAWMVRGIDFTANNQFVTLPSFKVSEGLNQPAIKASLSVIMWVYSPVAITTTMNLFRIFAAPLNTASTPKLTFSVEATNQFSFTYGSVTRVDNSLFTPGKWTLVSLNLVCHQDNYCLTMMTKDDKGMFTGSETGRLIYYDSSPSQYAGAQAFASSDVPILGGPSGFVGKVAYLQIFSPGSVYFNKDVYDCDYTCLFALGSTDSPECLSQTRCPTSCSECLGTNIEINCSGCKAGYFLNETECISCTTFDNACSECNNGTCTKCSGGMVVSGSGCACPAGEYRGGGSCNSCNVYLNPSCTACSDQNTCTSCSDPEMTTSGRFCVCPPGKQYYGGSGGSCTPCSGPCLCNFNQYMSNVTNTCAACSTLDASCVVCSDAYTCTHCTGGTFASGPSCACIPTQYFSISTSTCIDCSTLDVACTACSNANTCTQCSQGKTASGSTCACTATQYFSTSTSTCTTCSTLDAACTACSDANTCTQCSQGKTASGSTCACTATQYFSTSTSTCTACSTLDAACTACSDANTCTACSNDLKPSGSKCLDLDCSGLANCETCSSQSSCLTCNKGYFASSQGTCSDCPTGCSACSDALTCQECQADYVLTGSVCTLQVQVEVQEESSLSVGAIVGIAVGAGFSVIIVLVTLRIYVYPKMKKATQLKQISPA